MQHPKKRVHNLLYVQDKIQNKKIERKTMSIYNEKRTKLIISILRMDDGKILYRLQKIKETAFNEKKRLSKAHPDWNSQNDARLRVLNGLGAQCELTQFNLHILHRLAEENWDWLKLQPPEYQKSKFKNIIAQDFGQSTKYRFGMNVFTTVENNLRTFLRAIDPEACKEATTSFNTIYTCLLGSNQLDLPDDDKEETTKTLDFMRDIRNLIHNNGVYFDKDARNKNVTYGGKTYPFIHRKQVRFVDWELLLNLTENLCNLLIKVISHEKITLKSHIPYLSAAL